MMKFFVTVFLLIHSHLLSSCPAILWNSDEYSILIPHFHIDELFKTDPIRIPKVKYKFPLSKRLKEEFVLESLPDYDWKQLESDSFSYLIPITQRVYDNLPYGFILHDRNGKSVIKSKNRKLKFLDDQRSDLGILKEVLFIQKNLTYYSDALIYHSWGLKARTPQAIKQYLKDREGYKVIFFDLETTGLSPSQNKQITEVYARTIDLKVSGNKLKLKFGKEFHKNMKLDNNTIYQIQEEIKNPPNPSKNIKTIEDLLDMQSYPRKSKKLVSEREGLQEFFDFITEGEKKVLLVAQNIRFDYNFLTRRLLSKGVLTHDFLMSLDGEAHGGEHIELFDTKLFFQHFWIPSLKKKAEKSQKARAILSDLERRNPQSGFNYYTVSIGNIAKHFGVNIEGWHQAKEDTEMTLDIFMEAYEEVQKLNYTAEGQLLDPASKESYFPELPN